ncbi:MAG: hypothetical protein ABJN36_16640 [Cyclobacteriaceae bacterium]
MSIIVMGVTGSDKNTIGQLLAKQGSDHFIPRNLQGSQFDTLEEPQGTIKVDIESHLEFMVSETLKNLN